MDGAVKHQLAGIGRDHSLLLNGCELPMQGPELLGERVHVGVVIQVDFTGVPLDLLDLRDDVRQLTTVSEA